MRQGEWSMTRCEPSGRPKFRRKLLSISFWVHLLPHHLCRNHALSVSPVIVLQCLLLRSIRWFKHWNSEPTCRFCRHHEVDIDVEIVPTNFGHMTVFDGKTWGIGEEGHAAYRCRGKTSAGECDVSSHHLKVCRADMRSWGCAPNAKARFLILFEDMALCPGFGRPVQFLSGNPPPGSSQNSPISIWTALSVFKKNREFLSGLGSGFQGYFQGSFNSAVSWLGEARGPCLWAPKKKLPKKERGRKEKGEDYIISHLIKSSHWKSL